MGRKIDEVHEKKLTYKKNTLVGNYFAFKNYELSIKNLEFWKNMVNSGIITHYLWAT